MKVVVFKLEHNGVVVVERVASEKMVVMVVFVYRWWTTH